MKDCRKVDEDLKFHQEDRVVGEVLQIVVGLEVGAEGG